MTTNSRLFARSVPVVTKHFYCCWLAFLSGAIGLTSQIVWLRKFGQVFGGTVQAASVVVAATLAGLAMGAYFLGQRADSKDKPFRFAGWLMVLTGTVLAAGIVLFSAVDDMSYRLAEGAQFGPAIQVVLRVGLAGAVLLPPSFLLGGMLPTLIRALSSTAKALRTKFGLVYGLETGGGALGALLTGFGLIRWIGLNGTLLLASAISALAGALVLLFSRTQFPDKSAEAIDRQLPEKPLSDFSPARLRWCHVAVGLAGFASLGMEIVWTRLMLLVLGGDSFAYTTVVASYLVGLALGALLARAIVRRSSQPLGLFAWFQIIVAASSVALLVAFSKLAEGPGQKWLALWSDGWGTVIGGRFGFCLGLLLIPTIFIGLSVPTLAAYLLNSLRSAGKRAGRLYAANTLGNVSGALATGFVLIPQVGVQSSLVMLAGLSLGAAAIASIANGAFRAAKYKANAGVLVGRSQFALIVLGIIFCAGWSSKISEPLGVGDRQDDRVTYYREGPVATVMVLENRNEPEQRVMAVDGVIIGESHGGVDEKQRMLAHLPFLLRPHAAKSNVLTIGLGTGILAGELIGQPGVEQVTCVELSPSVIEGALEFADLNGNVQQDPRVAIEATDGIHYLRRRRVHYDAIISDAKSRPGHVGNVSFFSRDYYQLCHKRLAAEGIFVQWVSLETPNRALQIILRTFVSSFPHSAIGIAAPDSLYLVGAAKRLHLDAAAIQGHLESPSAAGLRQYEWRHACDVLGLIVADGKSVEGRLIQQPINTLDRPHLEFEAGDVFRTPPDQRKLANLRFLLSILSGAKGVPPALTDAEQLTTNCRKSARLMLEANAAEMAREEDWLEVATAKYQQALEVAEHHHRLRVAASEVAETHQSLALLARDAGDLRRASVHFYKAASLDADSLQVRLEFATTLAMMDKPDYARSQLQLALNSHPDEPRAHFAMGLVLLSQGQDTEALQHFRRTIELDGTYEKRIGQLGLPEF